MKRLFTLIVAICSIIAAMAQHPMVTISRNGELTQFTGMHAFDTALREVQKGDVIYLSEGEFLSEGTEKELPYGVSIVGVGYDSKLLFNLIICCYEDGLPAMDVPMLDGVYLKHLGFNYDVERRKFIEVRNCWIGKLEDAGRAAENFYINSCFIEDASFGGYDINRNVYINNSKIVRLGEYSQYIQVKNCNILKAIDCPRILINSIIASPGTDNGKLYGNGINSVYNSLLPSEDILNEEQITTLHDCYFENPANGLLDENLNAIIDLQAKGYLGQDGTVIGAYGGENPFSELPSVPSIDSEKSSVEFDPASKQLNVTITVAED